MGLGYQDYIARIKDKQEVELSSSRLLPTTALATTLIVIYLIIRIFNSIVLEQYTFWIWDAIVLGIGSILMYFLHAKLYVIKSKRGRIFANSSFKQYRIIPNQVLKIESFNNPPYTFFGLFRFVWFEFEDKGKKVKILTWRKSNTFDERYKLRKIFEALKTYDHKG